MQANGDVGGDEEFAALSERVRGELRGMSDWTRYERILTFARQGSTTSREQLVRLLELPGQPLWVRELAAFVLGSDGDRRAFETLLLLLNYRDPVRAATAAVALSRLGDPRTARAAAALVTNPLRTSYALHAVRLLVQLRAPESVPALVSTLERLLQGPDQHRPVALACVEGLGTLGDERAVPALNAARVLADLREAAADSLARIWREAPPSTV